MDFRQELEGRGNDYETRAGDVEEMEKVQGRNEEEMDMGWAHNKEGTMGDRYEDGLLECHR